MKLLYLGHSCFYIESGSSKIIIDPFFDIEKFSNISPTNIVLTHAHEDHIGHTQKIYEKCGSKIVATFELCNYLESKGCSNVCKMHIGSFVNQGPNFDVKFVQAMHSSSIDGIVSVGVPTGAILKLDGKIIYHCGDTGLFGDMELIGKRHNIDIAMVPIGGHFTMDIDDAIYATSLINPKLVIPMHYNTFPQIEVDPKVFVDEINQEPNLTIVPKDFIEKNTSKPFSTKSFCMDIGQEIEI